MVSSPITLKNLSSYFNAILPLIALSVLLVLPCHAPAGEGQEVIRRVQQKFEELTTLSAHFEVSSKTGGSDQIHREAGILYLDGSSRFRTETSSQTVVGDGSTVWIYDPLGRQVIIRNANEGTEDLITPQRILYQYPQKYRIEKVEEVEYSGKVCDLLYMRPRQETDPTKLLMVWVDRNENLTRKFLIEDLADNIITFEFEEFKLGGALPESTFRFVSPDSVEVIDLR